MTPERRAVIKEAVIALRDRLRTLATGFKEAVEFDYKAAAAKRSSTTPSRRC